MGLGWMGISIMFCLWREITRLPALCQLSARFGLELLLRLPRDPCLRNVIAPRDDHCSLYHLTCSSLLLLSIINLHHQQTTHSTNNSPNKPHQLFTMATLSCKSPLLPMPCASDDSELLVCCHLPQQQHTPSSPSLWHPSSKHH